MPTHTIGDIARQSGIPTSALRYYESIGLLPPASRVNGRRHYDADTLQRLAVIQFAQHAGFTLAEIHELFVGFPSGTTPADRWNALARRKLVELAAQQVRIRTMRKLLREGIRCGCLTMEQCVLWMSGSDLSE